MRFDAIKQPMVDWSYGKVGLVHTECPFDKEQITVILDDFLIFDLAVRHISLQSVKPRILGYLVLVYGDGSLTFQGE